MVESEDISQYNVLKNNIYGRYLVAKKDLDSGEIIFKDSPFAVGPKPDTPPLCLGCYRPVTELTCSKCGWPCCGPECEKSPHHQLECSVFSEVGVRFHPPKDWTARTPQLDCIMPLRILIAKEKNPDQWKKDLEPMETHTEERMLRPTWRADQINIANFLVDYCNLGGRFEKELIQRVCGILEVNSVEVPTKSGFRIRAIYPRLSITAHSCVPNIVHIIQDNYQVHIRASIPIKAGSSLYLSYAHALSPTLLRREFLVLSKFFACDCPRCADPTEYGTHMSSLKCSKCGNGWVMSTNPLDEEASWSCTGDSCEYTTSGSEVHKLLYSVQADIAQVDALQTEADAIDKREELINKYKTILHPHHALMLSVKHTLVQLYGRVRGYNLKTLPNSLLKRKIEYCRSIMKILDVITPGESRMRGMILYELYAPLMLLAQNQYSAKEITKEEFKAKFQEPIDCLAVAAKILSREYAKGHEGIIGRIAQSSIEQLQKNADSL